mgnify:CR=1 FL=1
MIAFIDALKKRTTVTIATEGERLCVLAVGGYGRGTLAPGSDIDLLFILPYKQTPWGESVVEAVLYMLWDLRQKVGHSTRSVDECLRQAREEGEQAERLLAKAERKASDIAAHSQHTDPAVLDQKRAIIEAALARARAKRLPGKP